MWTRRDSVRDLGSAAGRLPVWGRPSACPSRAIHDACALEMKVAAERRDDIWLARSGFGGTE